MSADGSLATTPMNGGAAAGHASLAAQTAAADVMSVSTTGYIDPTMLSVNGVSLEDSTGSTASDDEVYTITVHYIPVQLKRRL